MDREMVIKAMDYCLNGKACNLGCPAFDETAGASLHGCAVYHEALALLKAQEPVKPVVAHDGWYRCGKCNNSLASGERVKNFGKHPWPRYCENCGRAVKWDD